MSVAALVVTHNSAVVLPGLLETLSQAFAGVARWCLVVADNDSSDDSVAIIRQSPLSATVLERTTNDGYAAGINAAAEVVADVDALLVLNPDVRIGSRAVAALVSTLGRPDTAVAVPRIVGPSGAVEPSMRRESTVLRALGEAVLGGHRSGRYPSLGELVIDRSAYTKEQTVDSASGCAMLIDRRSFHLLRGFDEEFFHGSEETDFCLRAGDRGWFIRFQPAATVEHRGGDGAQSPVLRPIMFANRLELYRRRRGPVRAVAFRGALLLNEALRASRGPAYRATLRRLLRPGHPSRASA